MASRDVDMKYLRGVVERESSNRAAVLNAELFQRRLTRVAEREGVTDLRGLAARLRAEPAAHLHAAVAEAMTIKETSFFRDMTPWAMLRRKLLPEMIRKRGATRRLVLWSAASSTGQEAYSLAMMLLEDFPELAGWDVRIVATDISETAREYAARGRYRRLEINRGLPAPLLLKYFEPEGEEWVVRPEVRRLVSFQRMNLCEMSAAAPVADVVLLRNVLLYFSAEDRVRVLQGVHERMAADGALLLGATEQAEDSTDRFKVEFDAGCYFYRPVVG